MCCSVLPCVAVCCSVLQCVAVCSSVLQCNTVIQSSHLIQMDNTQITVNEQARRAIYLLKAAMYLLKRAIYFLQRAIYLLKRAIYLFRRAIYLLKRAIYLPKRAIYLLDWEICANWITEWVQQDIIVNKEAKEPYISSKEPYISSTEKYARTGLENAYNKMSLWLRKLVYLYMSLLQKSPIKETHNHSE